MKEFAISRDGVVLPLRIMAVSIDELPFLLLEMGVDGVVDLLEYEGTCIYVDEPDPQDN